LSNVSIEYENMKTPTRTKIKATVSPIIIVLFAKFRHLTP
jgi:hypothetical protein